MGDLAALRDAIQNAFADTRWDASYPIPQFHGKKEENPGEHSLKIEDWFAHFEIAYGDKVARFKETLFGCPEHGFTLCIQTHVVGTQGPKQTKT